MLNQTLTISEQKERTVFAGFILGLVSLIPFLVITIISGSIILMTEVFRSGNETLACLISWLVLKKVQSNPEQAKKLEYNTRIFTGVVLVFSFLVIIFNAGMRFMHPQPVKLAGGLMGIACAVGSGCVNAFLWRKNFQLSRQGKSPVMESQWRLFRTKFLANCCVSVPLSLCLLFAGFPGSVYIDPLVSILLAGLILHSAFRIFTLKLDIHE